MAQFNETELENFTVDMILNVTSSPNWDNSSSTGSYYIKCPTEDFYINFVAAGLICAFGLIGNSLSIWALSKDKQTPIATFLLRALAFADNVFLFLWFTYSSLAAAFEFFHVDKDNLTWYRFVQVLTYPILFMAQSATIWLTVLIAVTRFMAICRPYQAAQIFSNINKIRFVTIAVFVFSVLYNIPRFFESTMKKNYNENGTFLYWYQSSTDLAYNQLYRLIYFDILYYIFSFVLPLLIVAILNTKLTIAYRKLLQKRRQMNKRTNENDHNITLVLIIVVLVFMLCQAPARIVQIVWNYEFSSCKQIQFYLIRISTVLEVFNSSANFVIYCLFRNQFRDTIHSQFCGADSRRGGQETMPLNENTQQGIKDNPTNGTVV